MPSIGVFIPTYQAEKHLVRCLSPLLVSSLHPKILVIDSSSTDKTVSIAKSFGVEVRVFPKSEFNHGKTREMGRKLLQTDIVVMMTQDAYLVKPNGLDDLISPLQAGLASVSYARQIPHEDADIFASFSRTFNYPQESHVRSIADISTYGAYTFFCSNSCAAYKNAALEEVGGFPATSFGEDTIVVAKLLKEGHKIAYVAETEVYHSHNYSLVEEFLRHIAMGKERKRFAECFTAQGSTSERGLLYAKNLLGYLWKREPSQIPYAVSHLLAKWMGYRIGFRR